MTKQLQTAYNKGRDAALKGEPIRACPYEDKRTHRGSVTFSRAYVRAWEDGWEQGHRELKAEGEED
jgi:hypothetical protein